MRKVKFGETPPESIRPGCVSLLLGAAPHAITVRWPGRTKRYFSAWGCRTCDHVFFDEFEDYERWEQCCDTPKCPECGA